MARSPAQKSEILIKEICPHVKYQLNSKWKLTNTADSATENPIPNQFTFRLVFGCKADLSTFHWPCATCEKDYLLLFIVYTVDKCMVLNLPLTNPKRQYNRQSQLNLFCNANNIIKNVDFFPLYDSLNVGSSDHLVCGQEGITWIPKGDNLVPMKSKNIGDTSSEYQWYGKWSY